MTRTEHLAYGLLTPLRSIGTPSQKKISSSPLARDRIIGRSRSYYRKSQSKAPSCMMTASIRVQRFILDISIELRMVATSDEFRLSGVLVDGMSRSLSMDVVAECTVTNLCDVRFAMLTTVITAIFEHLLLPSRPGEIGQSGSDCVA